MAKAKGQTITIRQPKVKKRRHRKSMTFPMAAIAGFGPLVYNVYQDTKMGSIGMQQASSDIIASLTGWNIGTGKWEPANLLRGAVPILGGLVVHRVASRVGVNRMLSRAGIPFIRI